MKIKHYIALAIAIILCAIGFIFTKQIKDQKILSDINKNREIMVNNFFDSFQIDKKSFEKMDDDSSVNIFVHLYEGENFPIVSGDTISFMFIDKKADTVVSFKQNHRLKTIYLRMYDVADINDIKLIKEESLPVNEEYFQ